MKILAIIGSASENSSNLKIAEWISNKFEEDEIEIFDRLKDLPHFDTSLTNKDVPEEIVEIRNKIDNCDGIIISTPEYIFSIPSALKNMFEWCVSTMVFDQKRVQVITASANGEKGHEQLILILKTLGAKNSDSYNLIIPGIKGRFKEGELDSNTAKIIYEKVSDFLKSI